MNIKAHWYKHRLNFLSSAGTSRGVLNTRDVYYIKFIDNSDSNYFGIGECAPLKGLSIDDRPDLESYLDELCKYSLEINEIEDVYEIVKPEFPSVIFGFEMAFLDLQRGGIRQYFDTSFSHVGGKIPINGLIWMGTKEQMKNQIDEKLAKGFKVLKLKIGAIDFLSECQLLESIRNSYPSGQLEIRVDANGAFSYTDALDKLSTLSEFQLHSIEQPIRAGQPELMKRICQKSLVPVALDEELIGVIDKKDKLELLKKIKPQYIILKPTLVGGIKATREWIDIAENLSIGWWITSALESNIGLNAIAQLTSTYFPLSMPQGLGTGQLYTNNIEAPISVSDGNYVYLPNETWGEIL